MAKFDIQSIVLYVDDSTVNKTSYNCFCSLDEADTYHGRRLANNDWRTRR